MEEDNQDQECHKGYPGIENDGVGVVLYSGRGRRTSGRGGIGAGGSGGIGAPGRRD